MNSETIIILGFGILTLLILIILYFVNRLLVLKGKIESSFTPVKKIIINQVDLIDNMNNLINKTLEHEENYLKQLTQTKQDLNNITTAQEGVNILKSSEKILSKFTKLENTYEYLNKNEEYQEIKNNYLKNQDRIIYAMESYDKGVKKYNEYRNHKGINFLSKLFHLKDYDYYSE